MEKRISVFDVDGTLVDSLPAHIRFCNDKNIERNLKLEVINPNNREECQKIAGSSMNKFLRNYGFPEELIPELLGEYTKNFSQNYQIKAFDQIELMIDWIKNQENHDLGIISSNYLQNIQDSLTIPLFKKFDFVIGSEKLERDFSGSKRKALEYIHLNLYARGLPMKVTYVGDMRGDYKAAKSSNTRFIWVNWGWESPPQGENIIVAENPYKLACKLME